MITPKIKNLFQFIEYLHSNIENFNQYNDLINELNVLHDERNKLKPNDNYKDKLQYDKIQAELKIKFDELQNKTANPIKAKAKELNVCYFDNEPFYSIDLVGSDIDQLKANFNDNDLIQIFKHKNQYIEFRKNEYCYFLSLGLFFYELDRKTKALFDFFKEDPNQNEFEAFETKVIQVNNAKEAFKLMQKGELCAFNINPLNPSISQQQTNIEPLPPQPAEPKQEQQPPTFKNNFDNIKPTDIYNHFKAGLVDKGYFAEQELNKYLKAAFELKTIPETLFKIKDAPSKEKIYVVFYTYYINVAGKPHTKQTQYVELLGNYFEGYNNNTIRTNWARGYNPKKY